MQTHDPTPAPTLRIIVMWAAAVFLFNLGLTNAQAQHVAGKTDDKLRTKIQRAIVPIERAMVGYRENRRCFSCHHHAHAIIALSEIASRGLIVDRELLKIQFAQTVGRTRSFEQRYLKNQNIGGGVDTAGHALLAMRIGSHQPDPMTEAMIKWLLKKNPNKGFWTGTKNREPTQTSNVTRTWLCLDALNHFGTPELVDEIDERKTASRKWLLNVDAASTEDKNSRIRALSIIGDASDEIEKFSNALILEQNDDGGWAQTDEMESDAYATSSVLMTLHQYAGLSTNLEFYRRGIKFLSSTQQDDGTWHVKSRATPVQEYFESGFPHGRDQYISFTATCWAATALALTLPVHHGDRDPGADGLARPLVELGGEHHRQFLARFQKEIWPLISDNGKSSCTKCHDGKHRSSFRLTNDSENDFAMMLSQGFFHPQDPSGILFSITSKDVKLMMPPSKLPRWSDEQINALKGFTEELHEAHQRQNAEKQSARVSNEGS